MLELLHIENIAVIEEADIYFRPGFNALTGETGAGKSIVIDAMGAVLGGRTSRDLIRTGAEKAFVSAAFSALSQRRTGRCFSKGRLPQMGKISAGSTDGLSPLPSSARSAGSC